MFTGIIKDIGKVSDILKHSSCWRIAVESRKSSAQVSESIAVNGVCLTVVDVKGKVIFFDAVKPTLDISNLKRLKHGSYVNLESALAYNGKVEGHFVLGHIDCELRVKALRKKGGFYVFEAYILPGHKKYLPVKGSVSVNGVSLTIAEVGRNYFSANIIPYTCQNTNFKYLKPGMFVNIEFDYLLKSFLNVKK